MGKQIIIIICSGIKTLCCEDDTYAIVLNPVSQKNILYDEKNTYAVFRTEVGFSVLPINTVPFPESTIKIGTLIFPTKCRDGIRIGIPYPLGRL